MCIGSLVIGQKKNVDSSCSPVCGKPKRKLPRSTMNKLLLVSDDCSSHTCELQFGPRVAEERRERKQQIKKRKKRKPDRTRNWEAQLDRFCEKKSMSKETEQRMMKKNIGAYASKHLRNVKTHLLSDLGMKKLLAFMRDKVLERVKIFTVPKGL